MIRSLIAIFLAAATVLAGCTGPQATRVSTGTPRGSSRTGTPAAGSTPTRRVPTPPPVTTVPPTPAPTATPEERGERVIFPSLDGVRLRGALYRPPGEGPFKVVILLHDAGTDRHSWDGFIPTLEGAGYAVLAFDARGEGQSDPVAPDSALPDYRVYDVTGALNWLDTRPEIQPRRVAVMGAALGANVAFAANGGTNRIRTAVVISPVDAGGALMGTGVEDFSSGNVLYITDEASRPVVEDMIWVTRVPRGLYIAPPEITGQGLALLELPDVVTRILDWLAEEL